MHLTSNKMILHGREELRVGPDSVPRTPVQQAPYPCFPSAPLPSPPRPQLPLLMLPFLSLLAVY